ncbi:MAG TPA: exodeoxyribonuclease VII large subunit [Pyrinomonadaceae bacterium]|nr:exodeoxyribonuclease VII large subunit [Pyrinomonadaceae bacterium]
MTVSELNAEVRTSVEKGFANVWVEGEIVNFLLASSGHWYFSLNDGAAQVKCVCWKGTNYRIRFKPKNGFTVRIRGRLTFWEAKGELKLNVDSLEPSGEGALAAAFEQIKAKLEAEGLFAEELKRRIPFFPRRVAVITSRTGAAYHDICTVLTRRARSVSILLVPALVQGEGAAASIRQALANVNSFNRTLELTQRIDVVIVGRGGGSAEDLWAFNDELLARHIRSSEIPVISAVGHEIDWTISDMVADLRAATPSAAAELVAGREDEILNTLEARAGQLTSLLGYKLLAGRSRLGEAAGRLDTAFSARIQGCRDRLADIGSRLAPARLAAIERELANRLVSFDQRLSAAMERTRMGKSEVLELHMAKLNALSPLGVLNRGYSITQAADGRVLHNAADVKAGDELKIRLEHGKLNAEVLSSE